MTAPPASLTPQRWVPLGRAVAVVVLVLMVGLTIVDIPFQFAHNQTPCSGPACSPGDQLSPADVAQLQRVGLSPGLYAGYTVALNTIFVLAFVAMGGLIFWRKSRDWFGIFAAITLPLIGCAFGFSQTPPPAIVQAYPALYVPVRLMSMLGFVLLYVFFYLFPTGEFVPRWTLWLVPLLVVREAVAAFRSDLLQHDLWLVLEILSVAFAQVYRYRRVSNARQRQQTRWVVFGSMVAGGAAISLTALLPLVSPGSGSGVANVLIINTAWSFFMLFIPASMAVAILRSHLWDIEILIRRTLIYGPLTLLLAFIYLGAVVALQAAVTALTGQQRSEVVTVLSTLVIAALFVPLRNRVQAVIDHRFYRRKYDAARTLAQFGAALRDEVNLDDLSAQLLEAVDETMQPESVALWLMKRP